MQGFTVQTPGDEAQQKPFWVKCGKCDFCWSLYTTPIDMVAAGKLMARARCPKCDSRAGKIEIAKQEDGVLLEGRPEPDKAASIDQRAAQWRRAGDSGMSSIAIWEVMTGVSAPRSDHPHDPADLGRCLRLLDLIPEWKERLPVMCGLSKYWNALVPRWADLEAQPNNYKLIRSILDPVEKADPRVVRLGPGVSMIFGGR